MMALEIAIDEMAEKLDLDPDRVSHPQRHPGRSRTSRAALLTAPTHRMPAPRRRSLRLEQAQSAAWQDARRPLARRHGRRGGVPQQSAHAIGSARSARQSRRRDGRNRHDRHRHRQLHHHRADRGRDDGRAARQGGGAARRLRPFRFRAAPADSLAPTIRPRASMPRASSCARPWRRSLASIPPMRCSRTALSARAIAACRSPRRPANGGLVRRGRNRIRRSRQDLPAIDFRRAFRRSRRSMPQPAKSACAACLRCAPRAASSIRSRRAAR